MLMALVVLAVQLGGSFGTAGADISVVDGDTMEVQLHVEAGDSDNVVVHAVDPGGDQQTIAMIEVTPGLFRTRFEFRPLDLVIVFEDLDSGEQSDPVRLTELGAPPELLGSAGGVSRPGGAEEGGSPWGWLGLGLGLASLSLLAFWTLGSARDQAGEEE
ncbi:MAG: hypothetical protein OEW30_09765 [Acidimicrobiia bacterium]|nr:hypothetical protein [Acidimicrobiia bacterium]